MSFVCVSGIVYDSLVEHGQVVIAYLKYVHNFSIWCSIKVLNRIGLGLYKRSSPNSKKPGYYTSATSTLFNMNQRAVQKD